jgi:phosphate-selective porin OprO and OprP
MPIRIGTTGRSRRIASALAAAAALAASSRIVPAEETVVKEKQPPIVSAGAEGISIRSADGDFQLKLRGLVQTDGRFFSHDQDPSVNDSFLLRRVRPIVEGTVYKRFDVRIMPDFGEGKTVLQDAFMEARLYPALKLRAGKFKAPLGLERLMSAADVIFVERALPTNLVPNRDVGLQLHGDVAGGVLGYAAGIFNGVPDGASADADTNEGKESVARLFAYPFKKTSIEALQGLGIGVAGSRGSNEGLPKTPGLAGAKSAGQATFFEYRSDGTAAGTTVGAGRRQRFSPQISYLVKRLGVYAEYVASSQEVKLGGTQADLRHEAWEASASFFLTGDKATWGGVSPSKPFDPAAHSAGAFQVVARVGRLVVDGEDFPVFADPTRSARRASEAALGANWYLNKGVKLMLLHSRTAFSGGAPSGDRDDERVTLGRLQISF